MITDMQHSNCYVMVEECASRNVGQLKRDKSRGYLARTMRLLAVQARVFDSHFPWRR